MQQKLLKIRGKIDIMFPVVKMPRIGLYGNLVEISNFRIPVSLAHKEALMQALRLS
jgi:hypothetical protein